MHSLAAIEILNVSHFYGPRQALKELSLDIQRGEIFAFLGPNGGGKTTLFRILSTLLPLSQGEVRILGKDLRAERTAIQTALGVVFQSPSLDKKLTVSENIRHHAALYGLAGGELKKRTAELLEQLGLSDRGNELTESLSGGLRRRVELAKSMIHRPQVLLMDEPSTGLDPAARSDLWRYLQRLRSDQNVTVALTTHLLEEAEKADRLAILHQGQLAALDTPQALRSSLGGDSITIETPQPEELSAAIQERFSIETQLVDEHLRLSPKDQPGAVWVARLAEAFPEQIQSIKLGKPTLEDVFIAKTGHRFWSVKDPV